MGSLDNAFGSAATAAKGFEPTEAVAGILLSTVAADGHISQDEAVSLTNNLVRMSLFSELDCNDINQMMGKLCSKMRTLEGDEFLKQVTAACPPELRETAFALSTDLIMEDGVAEDEEREHLGKIQANLSIPEARALQIIDVIVVKNKG